MRWHILSLCLGLLFCLSACEGVLDRSYSNTQRHVAFRDEEEDANILRADSYQSLVSAILYLVGNAKEQGIIRLYDLTLGEQDIDRACWEVAQEDPLGAYALDYLKYDMARLEAYTELDLQPSYRRSWQQISAVSSVTGSSAIVGELRQALGNFEKEIALRVSYFDPNITETDLQGMLQEAYYDVPAAAFGLPTMAVSRYPETVRAGQVLLEFSLEYAQTRDVLWEQQNALLQEVKRLYQPKRGETAAQMRQAIAEVLAQYPPVETGEGTPYATLLRGNGNVEGLTLTAELFCQQNAVLCRMVRGTRAERAQLWLLVQVEDKWQHWDVVTGTLLGDGEMKALGYVWSGEFPLAPDVPTEAG